MNSVFNWFVGKTFLVETVPYSVNLMSASLVVQMEKEFVKAAGRIQATIA